MERDRNGSHGLVVQRNQAQPSPIVRGAYLPGVSQYAELPPPPGPIEWQPGQYNILNYHSSWRPTLFRQKLSEDDVLIPGKAVAASEFEPYGFLEPVRQVGWQGILSCYEKVGYQASTVDWMSTMRLVRAGDAPETHSLVGTVRGRDIPLDLATIRRLLGIETDPGRNYWCPTIEELQTREDDPEHWNNVIDTLFHSTNPVADGYLRENLRLVPKILWRIGIWNMFPRLGDQNKVRRWDCHILYALMKGDTLSLARMILLDIEAVYVLRDRASIPYGSLLTRMLQDAGISTPNVGIVPWRAQSGTIHLTSQSYQEIVTYESNYGYVAFDTKTREEYVAMFSREEQERRARDDVYQGVALPPAGVRGRGRGGRVRARL